MHDAEQVAPLNVEEKWPPRAIRPRFNPKTTVKTITKNEKRKTTINNSFSDIAEDSIILINLF